MSSNARIGLVLVLLLFAGVGIYYATVGGGTPAPDQGDATTEGGDTGNVTEPDGGNAPAQPRPEPELGGNAGAGEDDSDDDAGSARVPISTNVVRFHVTVDPNETSSSIQRLRTGIRTGGPDAATSPLHAWIPLANPVDWAVNEDALVAMRTDPTGYFADVYGLVVEPADDQLWVMVAKLSARSLVGRLGRSVEVMAAERIALGGDDDETNDVAVLFELGRGAADRFAELTRENVGRPLAIVLDDKVVAVNRIEEEVTDGRAMLSVRDDARVDAILAAFRGETLPATTFAAQARAVGAEEAAEAEAERIARASDPAPDRPAATSGEEGDATGGGAASGGSSTGGTDPVGDPPRDPRDSGRTWTVAAGDTMASIAEEWLGDATKWIVIAEANPLVDPNRLRIGQVLRLPAKNAEPKPIDTAQTVYVVRSGDTLSTIARAYYGDSKHWRRLFEANREMIGDDPGALRVGMRLTIPAP